MRHQEAVQNMERGGATPHLQLLVEEQHHSTTVLESVGITSYCNAAAGIRRAMCLNSIGVCVGM